MPFDIAPYIDHTALKPTATRADIEQLCNEAMSQRFAAVCVSPYYVSAAKKILAATDVKVATVIGFPFGYNTTPSKLAEIQYAIADGADEFDIVHNIAALKNKEYNYWADELMALTSSLRFHKKIIKVIIESGILSDEEIIKACELYSDSGIDYMKTSTGYAEAGASVHMVALMRAYLPEGMGIKASGGIRTFAFAKELIDAGATRIGCSAGMQIVQESKQS